MLWLGFEKKEGLQMSATIVVPLINCGREISIAADKAIFHYNATKDVTLFGITLECYMEVDATWQDIVRVHGQAMRAQGLGGYITYDENNNKVYDMSHPEYRIPRKTKNA